MKTNITRTIVAAIGLAFAAAACSGGPGLTPAASPASPSSGPTGNAIFVVKIPNPAVSSSAGDKRPAYLTPQVKGIDFSVSANDSTWPLNRGYAFFALTPQSTYCTTGPSALTCTLSVQAYPGNDLFQVSTYDQSNPTTPAPNFGSSHVISTGFVTANIASGATNTIAITTAGIVSTVLIGLDAPYPATGTASTQSVHVTGVDADNNVIVGNFDSPLSLTDSDSSGVTSLSTASLASSGTATLNYTGTTLGSAATIRATTNSPLDYANGGPFSGQTTFMPGSSSYWSAPQYLAFGGASAVPQTITIHGPATVWSSVSGCIGTVTVSQTAPTYTITPVAAGKCTLQLFYNGPPSATVLVPIVIAPPN